MAAKPLKILYVTAELTPLVTTGGLGDVARALPQALHAQGHDVRIALPCYGTISRKYWGSQYCLVVAKLGSQVYHGALRIARIPETGIPLFFIEHQGLFDRGHPYSFGAYEYADTVERFSFFCLSLLDGVPQTGWVPDVVHCNDWHTALVAAHMRTRYTHDRVWGRVPTVFTIHNLNYQGRYPAWRLPQTGLGWELYTPNCLEFYGDINLMKAGIVFATKVNTVSPRYAREIQTGEYGAGLDGLLRTRRSDIAGILNGIDYSEWNPKMDTQIPAQYSAGNLGGKDVCKAALQKAFGLPRREAPLFGMVSRINWQKGFDILVGALEAILAQDVQVVILGSGEQVFERVCVEAARRYPKKVGVRIQYNARLARLIYAGSDFFLMPSHYEPCGLSQMYSLAYGTVPIVRETGGLADTVCDVTPETLAKKRATGIIFGPAAPGALAEAVDRAIRLYQDPNTLHAVRLAGMRKDFSWARSARAYVRLYRKALDGA